MTRSGSHFLYTFSIVPIALCLMLAIVSCDENSNIISGGGDMDLDGDDGGPLLGSPMKPVLNFTGIGIDYDPEARCSENDWSMGPVACNPQVGFTCPTTGKTLDNCPTSCQACYDSDLDTIKNTLNVDTITIYQPNYYILTAAQSKGVEVILGIFNDQVKSLSSRHCSNNMSMMCAVDSDCGTGNTCMDDSSGCTFSGFPALCGTGQAKSILDGACGSTTPWPAANFCEAAGAYITPNADFISGGTVIGIQIGNEVLTSGGLTKAEVVNAAKILRNELNTRSTNISDIPIIVSLVVGKEQEFCENGAPPEGVDYIAAHPYCNNVASSPPSWPFETGNTAKMAASMCWDQVKSLFEDNAQMFCGADNTYIGETGYNTGCPGSMGESTHLAVAPDFIDDVVSWTCSQSIGTFLFAFVDACPMGGCLAGCSGESVFGNGYFGLYYTDMYDTMGSLTAKYSPLPTLTCP